jgi:hypothetical protein
MVKEAVEGLKQTQRLLNQFADQFASLQVTRTDEPALAPTKREFFFFFFYAMAAKRPYAI